MTNLDATQEAHLIAFEGNYRAYLEARKTLEAALRAKLEKELLSLRIKAAESGHRAIAAGVPKGKLGDLTRDGMRTKNYGTIDALLSTVELHAEKGGEATPATARYAIADNVLTVTLDQPALKDTLVWLGYHEHVLVNHPEWGTARFTIVTTPDGRTLLDNETPDWMPEVGNRHPVVAWLDDDAHKAEAVAFVTEGGA